VVVYADAEERAVSQRHEPEASHERPRVADERPDEDLNHDVEHVLLHPAHGHEGEEGDRDEHGEGDRAFGHCRFAKMPPGRMNISTMKSANAIT
jgi:hypothetical protein